MTSRALLLWGVLGLAPAAAAAPETIVELEDPPGDADGPGGYLAPTDSELSRDDFDLLRFTVKVDGPDAVFEVTLGAPVRTPSIPQRTNATLLALTNGLYLQNIDIYLDTDPTPGRGHAVCIPGRRVAFSDGRTWEKVVVLTPQPASTRSVIAAAFGDFARDVILPGPLLTRGRKVIARVPLAALGGRPRADWGYSVQLSGAAWERNFNLVDVVKGAAQPDALTMPVQTTVDRWAFGGGDGSRTQPQVIDLIVPKGREQHEVLSGSSEADGTYAAVPFVYVVPPPVVEAPPVLPVPESAKAALAPPPAPGKPAGPVVSDVSDELVTVVGVPQGLPSMAIGQVLGPDGEVVARVVVLQAVKGGVVASVLDHKERITRGARVRFAGTDGGIGPGN